jgi:hypothetical protein
MHVTAYIWRWLEYLFDEFLYILTWVTTCMAYMSATSMTNDTFMQAQIMLFFPNLVTCKWPDPVGLIIKFGTGNLPCYGSRVS